MLALVLSSPGAAVLAKLFLKNSFAFFAKLSSARVAELAIFSVHAAFWVAEAVLANFLQLPQRHGAAKLATRILPG